MLTGRKKILELQIKILSLFSALPKSHYPGALSNGILGGKKRGCGTHAANQQQLV